MKKFCSTFDVTAVLSKPSFNIGRDAGIQKPLLVLNDINKPGGLFHVKIISTMDKIRIPFSEFHFSFSRSGGAGGQNINKVNTKAILYWDLDGSPSCTQGVKDRFRARYGNFILDDGSVQIISQEHRTQKGNVDECIDKLHAMLDDVARPPKVRKATKPKRSAILKRLSTKKKDGEKKQNRRKDF